MKRKDIFKEFLFRPEEYSGIKMLLTLLFIFLITILQLMVTTKMIITLFIEISILASILFFLAKFLLYNRKEHKKTTVKDRIFLVCFIILLIYNTYSFLSEVNNHS